MKIKSILPKGDFQVFINHSAMIVPIPTEPLKKNPKTPLPSDDLPSTSVPDQMAGEDSSKDPSEEPTEARQSGMEENETNVDDLPSTLDSDTISVGEPDIVSTR